MFGYGGYGGAQNPVPVKPVGVHLCMAPARCSGKCIRARAPAASLCMVSLRGLSKQLTGQHWAVRVPAEGSPG